MLALENAKSPTSIVSGIGGNVKSGIAIAEPPKEISSVRTNVFVAVSKSAMKAPTTLLNTPADPMTSVINIVLPIGTVNNPVLETPVNGSMRENIVSCTPSVNVPVPA